MIFPLLASLMTFGAAGQGADKARLSPYAETLPCAAYTHAAMQIEKGKPGEAARFDHLIFWGMATADAGRAEGKTEQQVDSEVRAMSARFQPKLSAGDMAAKQALADCVARVPPLD